MLEATECSEGERLFGNTARCHSLIADLPHGLTFQSLIVCPDVIKN